MEHTMEKIQPLRYQLKEAQYLADIIGDDAGHPVFDRKHPLHQKASLSFQLLQDSIQDLSVQLDQAYRKSGVKFKCR